MKDPVVDAWVKLLNKAQPQLPRVEPGSTSTSSYNVTDAPIALSRIRITWERDLALPLIKGLKAYVRKDPNRINPVLLQSVDTVIGTGFKAGSVKRLKLKLACGLVIKSGHR